MHVRQASFEDQGQLHELVEGARAAFGEDPEPLERFSDFLGRALGSQAYELLVAEEDGRLVGLCSLAYFPTTYRLGTLALLDDLFVREDSRGRGTAKALLAAARTRAEERGAVELRLLSDDEPRLRKLHQGQGFRPYPLRLLHLPLTGPSGGARGGGR